MSVLLFLRNSSSDKVCCENRAVARKIARNLVYSAPYVVQYVRQNVSMCVRKLRNTMYLWPAEGNAKIVGWERKRDGRGEAVVFLPPNSICEKTLSHRSLVCDPFACDSRLIANSENASVLLSPWANLTAHTWNNRREYRGENRVRNFTRCVMAQRDLLKSTKEWRRYIAAVAQNRFLVYFAL